MKYTLLQMTQDILSSMDSDEITSINDSVESLQVAKVIRAAYFDLINRGSLPEHFSLVNLDPSLDNTKPTLMFLPLSVNKIYWIKYDKATVNDTFLKMEDVKFLPLEDFIDMMYQMNTDTDVTIDTFTHTINANNIKFVYRNDRAPTYYTTFDDNTVVFDSYDSAVDTTLQKDKTLCKAKMLIDFELVDSFIPNLDEPQFALLLNEAKSLAWTELKQSQHPKAELNARRGWTQLIKSKTAIDQQTDFDKLPNFGR